MTTLRRNGNGALANGRDSAAAEITLVSMAEIEPRPIDWLWSGRIARRKLTLITGDPDLGKSQIGLDAIARITAALPWPDQASGNAPLGSCIILSAEDAADDVLRPRLEAVRADLNRTHTIKSVLIRDHDGKVKSSVLCLQRDIEELGKKIEAVGDDVSLIVVDPLNAYFGDKIDTHQTAPVRAVLARLDGFANEHNIAILGIMHPPKTVAGVKAINAVTGSQAFMAAARMAFLSLLTRRTRRGGSCFASRTTLGPRPTVSPIGSRH